MKRHSNLILLFILFSFTIIFSYCSDSENKNTSDVLPTELQGVSGEAVFKQNCVTCHGIKGDLGMNGAKNLIASELTLPERIERIKYGKNAMTAFEKTLSLEQIEAVAAYTFTLKQE